MGEREIKVGQVWRNCIAEVEVTFRDVSYYYPKIRTTFSGGLTDEMDERVFRATHVWVSDPVKTPVTLEIGSPLVKALDELSDTHPGDEFELRHVRAVMTEWRAIKAKMGVK